MCRKVINVVVKGNNIEYLKCTSDFDNSSYITLARLSTLFRTQTYVGSDKVATILPYSAWSGSGTPELDAFAIMPDMPIVYQGNTMTIRDLIEFNNGLEIYNALPRITEEEFYSDTLD